MNSPASTRHRLDHLLSQNDLSESWQATNCATGSPCFVKIVRIDAKIGDQGAKAVLSNSFALQRCLGSTHVLKGCDRYIDGDKLIIEYPWLDQSRWQELLPSVLWNHFNTLLPRICQIADYLHLLGLVHNDLKVANFQVSTDNHSPRIILTDLDYLTAAGASPDARILGTPGHVAPEILNNHRVLPQSDNYSLGISLGLALLETGYNDNQTNLNNGVNRLQVNRFIEGLCNSDPYQRPRFLTEHLHECGLVNDVAHERTQRELMVMVLLSRLAGKWHKTIQNPTRLELFLQKNCRVFGLHRDLLECLSIGFKHDARSTYRLLKDFLANVPLEQHGDIWLLSPTDSMLESLYDALPNSSTEHPVKLSTGLAAESTIQDFIRDAIGHRDRGKIELAYITVRKALRQADAESVRSDAKVMTRALLLAGELALGLNRQSDAELYYSQVAAVIDISHEYRLKALYELFAIVLARGDRTRSSEILNEAVGIAHTTDHNWYKLAFRRYQAWLKILDNSFDEADAQLVDLVNDSLNQGIHYVAVMALYTRALPFWWKGDLNTAKSLLIRALELAKDKDLLPQAIPVISILAQLCVSRGEYSEAVRYGKLAIQTTPHIECRPALSSIDASLVQAHNRLANYPKAVYWLEHFLARGLSERTSRHLLVYYQFKAAIALSRTDLISAQDSIFRGLECDKPIMNMRSVVCLYHNQAELCLYTGATEYCLSSISRGQESLESATDVALSLELDLFGVLARLYQDPQTHWGEIVDVAGRLTRHGSRFYAAHGILLAMTCPSSEIRHQAATLGLLLNLRDGDQRVPVFAAITRLLHLYTGEDTPAESQIQGWKDALAEIGRSENRFLELIVVQQLAQLYLSNNMGRHAAKFFQQAQKLALGLGNQFLAEHASEGHKRSEALTGSRSELIASFHSLTQLLGGRVSFHDSLHKMLQFAVSQSGAERGVLLFPIGGTRVFRAVAAVNCDDQSVSDIVDFSLSIPRLVAQGIKPLIIENALEDHRTSKYQSVAIHNIMSVVAVPILDGAELIGVLYLDHHTIPALFSADDLNYILAIADLLSVLLTTSQELRCLRTNVQELEKQLGTLDTFISRDQSLLKLFEHLPQFAKTSVSILIQGESGTGKEVLCHEIHRMSLRSGKPLIKLNCAAIAANMIEAELFGVAKHAATGVAEREGKLSAADGGTLFLDEIGDMPLDTQAKVLRALEYQEFEKVGSNRVIHTDIRFIYATNKDLAALVEEGRFRRDLFFRINTVVIRIPPLREHPDDVTCLLEHFVRVFDKSSKPLRFSGDSIAILSAYPWPGNTRELRNLVERLCIVHSGALVTPQMLPPDLVAAARQPATRQTQEAAEARLYRTAYHDAGGNQSEIARILKVPLSTVRRKLRKYGIL